MNRRELLQGAALAAAVLATGAKADESTGMSHEHHMHHGLAGASPDYSALAHAATHCVMFGEACIDHCLMLLGEGDREMAACARSVEQMLAVCTALRQLATFKSAFVPRFAAVVADVCKACEAECRKHAKKHQECKACADACLVCIDECLKVSS